MIEQLLHSFFNFLGEREGVLLLTTIEFLFFLFVTYMITSEWTKNKKKELRFLIIAFGCLSLSKLFSVFVLSAQVFTNIFIWSDYIYLIDNIFWILSLFLVANGFIYPILLQKKYEIKMFVLRKLALLVVLNFVMSMFVLVLIDLKGGSFSAFWSNTSTNIGQMIILLYYSGFIIFNQRYRLNYKADILFALLVFSVAPIINIYNILVFNNHNRTLIVASSPFPLISMIIFARIIYLKLVNKAALLDRLRKSEQRYEREKELSNLKDVFISTVSHELKTPLTSMKLYVHLLKDKKLGPVTKKQAGSLKIIDSEVTRLNALITDILDLSKLEAQKSRLVLSEFVLEDVIKNDIYLTLAKKKNVDVVVNIPKNFIVTADKDKIQQIYINLFNNALKHTNKNGVISVRAADQTSEWVFEIADTGEGIHPDAVPNLFNRFYQAEDVMTRKQGGFGLGLAIVKSLVDLHKGKISVDSEVGKGTKIAIKFPKMVKY